ncbi:MAG: SGNH/GDSL hydrolase family protein [Planctomycetaceae bacterium]|nr:SGNH/GDSL hydrolase family protein [Planctomycetaceae bacterium]
MTEWILSRTEATQRLSRWCSGTFAGIVCWSAGIGLAAASVLFAFAGGGATRLFGMVGLTVGSLLCGLARTAPPWLRLRLAGMLISSVTILLISEVAMRTFTVFPVNTESNKIPHPQLGYVLDPKMSDVDEHGFRNSKVMATAEIAAIGDSHTQGVNSTAAGAWPQQLGNLLNTSVCNFGVGGYGPLQYDLLIDEALKLKPRAVVVGLYLGNDLGDVTRGIQTRHTTEEVENTFRCVIRNHTAIGSASALLWQRSRPGRPRGFELTHTQNPGYVSEQRIDAHSQQMDLSDPKIEAAFRDVVEILTRADSHCRAAGATLLVALIPTRESVYFAAETSQAADPQAPGDAAVNQNRPYYSRDGDSADTGTTVAAAAGTSVLNAKERLAQLAHRESRLRTHLMAVLGERRIAFTDLLPALTEAVNSQPGIYPSYDEGHPLQNGYTVYATEIARALTNQLSTTVTTN